MLAQLPTVVLGGVIISLAVLLAVVGAVFTQRRVPVKQRQSRTTGLSEINGILSVMFGVIVGFSAFLVLNKYHAAQEAAQSGAGAVEEIYRLAEPLPAAERDRIQGLATSYARVVVEHEWPLMQRGGMSTRADYLADELRKSIQEGYKTSTGPDRDFFAAELDAVGDLDQAREGRLLIVSQRLPSVLWVSLVVLAAVLVGLSFLIGMESHRLHLLSVATLTTGIVLVLFTIGVLDRPFGTDLLVGPQPFELVLREIGTEGGNRPDE